MLLAGLLALRPSMALSAITVDTVELSPDRKGRPRNCTACGNLSVPTMPTLAAMGQLASKKNRRRHGTGSLKRRNVVRDTVRT